MEADKTLSMQTQSWPPGQFKVVEPHELERWTGSGWKLVFVTKVTRMAEYEDQEANPKFDPMNANQGSYGNSYDRNGNEKYVRVRRFKKVSEPRFVLVRDENSLADVLTRERDAQTQRASQAEHALEEAGRKLEESGKKLAETDAALKKTKDGLEREQGSTRSLNDRVRAYEHDIAKLREQLGAKVLRDVLGHD